MGKQYETAHAKQGLSTKSESKPRNNNQDKRRATRTWATRLLDTKTGDIHDNKGSTSDTKTDTNVQKRDETINTTINAVRATQRPKQMCEKRDEMAHTTTQDVQHQERQKMCEREMRRCIRQQTQNEASDRQRLTHKTIARRHDKGHTTMNVARATYIST